MGCEILLFNDDYVGVIMKIKAIALAAATSFCAFDAAAAGPDVYFVGSVGMAKYDIDDAADYYKEEAKFYNSIPGVTASTKIEDDDVVYSLGIGAWVNQYVAVEFFYRDYGQVSASLHATDGVDSEDEKTELTVSGIGAGVVGVLPVTDRFSLLGRLDLVNIEAEGKDSYRDFWGDQVRTKYEDTNLAMAFGVGAQYKVNDQFTVRLDVQRIEVELDDEYEDDSVYDYSYFDEYIDSVNLSLVVNF